MQEVVNARLVRYQDGRPDIHVQLRGQEEWTLPHRLLEQRLRIVQFIPFPGAGWRRIEDDELVWKDLAGCAIIESIMGV